MNFDKTSAQSFPPPVRTISTLLLLLFCIEIVIMYALPYLVPLKNPYLENFADATLLTLLFTPALYHLVFKPFQKIAAQQKSLMENVLASLVDGVITFDQSLAIRSCNGAAERIFCYGAGDMIGRDLNLILETSSLAELTGAAAARRKSRAETGTFLECSGRRKDGSPVSLELSLSQVELGEGWIWLGIIRDICSRKKGEAEVKQTLSLLHATLESTAEGIIVRDLIGRSVISNRRFAEMWRIPPVVLASRDNKVLHSYVEDQLKDPQGFRDLTEKQLQRPESDYCDILAFRDGRVFERVVTPQVIERGVVGQVICCRDITEQRNLEHQLRQTQKMEALGTLASGVAHDFNNILTVIMGYCNLSAVQLDPESPVRLNLNQIMSASERAATLTSSLLAYGRKQAIDPQPLELNWSVKQMDQFLSRLIGEQIELVTKLCKGKLTILADSGQFEQVLMNLAANARDAMERGGCLSIVTGRITIDQDFIRLHGYGAPGDYAMLSVSDTGSGMDETTREKIFEPFFTTKPQGQGTGLGLSIVYGIVKQHGGYLNVYSEPGLGTTFNIYFPLGREARSKATPETRPMRGGSETILLAEDDAGVRALVTSVLSTHGYRVIEACDGEDALDKFTPNRESIDLLILDVIMPKKNGMETLLAISALQPDVRAIFISGYTAGIIEKNGLIDRGLHLLSKPLLPHQLLAKVREVLETG
jgi:two-component system, cell cycle sensor histidine kinase and response regulator CckA